MPMMKWWCVGLLALNVLYFGFEYNRHVGQIVRQGFGEARLPDGVATLTLLRERPEPPALRDEPTERSEAAAAAQNEPPTPVVAEQTEPEPSPQAEVAPQEPAEPEAPPPQVRLACASMGAFPSPDEADQARQRIGGQHIEGSETRVRRRGEQEVVARRYWVYLDNQGSEALARTRLTELAAKGVEDYLLNRTGNPKNAISLGLYSTESSVKARVAALERLGFRPAVQERHRTREIYWLDIAAREEVLSEIRAALPDGLQLVPVGCDEIALGSTPP